VGARVNLGEAHHKFISQHKLRYRLAAVYG